MRAIFQFRALLLHVISNKTWWIRKSEEVCHWSHWTRWNDVTWQRSGCQETIHGSTPFFRTRSGSPLMDLMTGDHEIRIHLSSDSPKKDGCIMVWAMVQLNGLLSYKILCRDFKSPTHIDLLCETIVSICKLNYGNEFLIPAR